MIYRLFTARKGREMTPRNMSNTYRHMSIRDLQELKSRKLSRARKLEKSYSYLDWQELQRIRFNVKQIDAEIACKIDQLSFMS